MFHSSTSGLGYYRWQRSMRRKANNANAHQAPLLVHGMIMSWKSHVISVNCGFHETWGVI